MNKNKLLSYARKYGFLDWLLGHRLLIPLAKLLRFKADDVERTGKKVRDILGDDDVKSEKVGKRAKRRTKTNH